MQCFYGSQIELMFCEIYKQYNLCPKLIVVLIYSLFSIFHHETRNGEFLQGIESE